MIYACLQVLGNICFLIMATSFAFIPAETLGTWQAVVPLYAAYGIGRTMASASF